MPEVISSNHERAQRVRTVVKRDNLMVYGNHRDISPVFPEKTDREGRRTGMRITDEQQNERLTALAEAIGGRLSWKSLGEIAPALSPSEGELRGKRPETRICIISVEDVVAYVHPNFERSDFTVDIYKANRRIGGSNDMFFSELASNIERFIVSGMIPNPFVPGLHR